MKTCRMCNNLLPFSSFHKDRKNKDGFKNICKKCRSSSNRPNLSKERKRFDRNLKHQIYLSLKRNSDGKNWENMLGITLGELREHLEKQFDENMSWDNFGSYWWVDKIIPCSKYRYSAPGEFRKCWSLKNLRPLYKKDCQKKSNNIYFKLVEKYSLFDILPIGLIYNLKGEDNESHSDKRPSQ